eukprot:2687010-Pyramimonas_sp.AAC.1
MKLGLCGGGGVVGNRGMSGVFRHGSLSVAPLLLVGLVRLAPQVPGGGCLRGCLELVGFASSGTSYFAQLGRPW